MIPVKAERLTLFTLIFFTIFFSILYLTAVWFHPDDGQTRTVFSGLLTASFGALTMFLRPDKTPPPGSTTVTKMDQTTTTPPDTNGAPDAPVLKP